MHRNAMLMRRIRLIDNPPENNGGDAGGNDEPVDWEAKYKDAVKHSRECLTASLYLASQSTGSSLPPASPPLFSGGLSMRRMRRISMALRCMMVPP